MISSSTDILNANAVVFIIKLCYFHAFVTSLSFPHFSVGALFQRVLVVNLTPRTPSYNQFERVRRLLAVHAVNLALIGESVLVVAFIRSGQLEPCHCRRHPHHPLHQVAPRCRIRIHLGLVAAHIVVTVPHRNSCGLLEAGQRVKLLGSLLITVFFCYEIFETLKHVGNVARHVGCSNFSVLTAAFGLQIFVELCHPPSLPSL